MCRAIFYPWHGLFSLSAKILLAGMENYESFLFETGRCPVDLV